MLMYDKSVMKEYVDKVVEAVVLSAEKASLEGTYDRPTRVEIAIFFIYLAMADGEIDIEEAREVGDFCGIEINEYNLKEYIEGGGIEKPEFVDKPPIIFQMMVEMDKVLYEMDMNIECAKSMLDVYKYFGAESVRASGDRPTRKMRYVQYIGMMERFMHEDLDGKAPANTIDSTKNEKVVVKPSQKGVPAPKKG